ncbi:hypothetical protein SAMN02745673_01139 [Marinactinospora thermotolerans DSM 45154]|uniref:Uncharacterized protein n=1 Tax=Marinactinospora thermotolerans DSM 45154 TaxID=1122192 RepID=A0A1T4MUH6_9ACTN|nr:hypothetical protein SAMN02745673_01139 [Marinactinospora thermotolerans DSM 45154]
MRRSGAVGVRIQRFPWPEGNGVGGRGVASERSALGTGMSSTL